MALVPCSECGKEISDKAIVCPNCGIKRKKDLGNVKGCLGVTSIFIVVFFVVLFIFSLSKPKQDTKPNAIDVCKMMLRMQSANPDNVQIDDINGVKYGDEITYEWTPFTLKLQNQHGALVGVSATCVTDTKINDVVRFILPEIK
ncbi:zinc ribbon domain-containing protein [Pectobacterium peruviense]|uniref:zinc ribbon domain-containing protein n=1 Tax=Pectobacterium peruviense TaxID=2066479 RepID=UPI000DE4D080|nr:zinc ribbon domain-containing protein [Pectobacterium peruviense]